MAGAVFGLTCSKYQSGEIDRNGRISRCGDEMMRVMLYESSSEHAVVEEMVLAQGVGDAGRKAPWDEKGDRGAGAPVGRHMHRIWVDGTEFRWPQEQATVAA